jgi:hypothetical protein
VSRWLTPVQVALAVPQLALVLAGWLAVRLIPGLSRACLPCPEQSDYDGFEPTSPVAQQGRARLPRFRASRIESWQLN